MNITPNDLDKVKHFRTSNEKGDCFPIAEKIVNELMGGDTVRKETTKCQDVDTAIETIKKYLKEDSLVIFSPISFIDHPNKCIYYHSYIAYSSESLKACAAFPGDFQSCFTENEIRTKIQETVNNGNLDIEVIQYIKET